MPAEFGLIGMISILLAVGTTLVDGGLTLSLIRSPNPLQEDYSSVFYLNVAIGVLIYLVAFFSAPFVAAFYEQPILTDIIRVYSLTFIISSFSSVQNARLTKEMQFKKQLIVQLPSLFAGACVGIGLALSGFGVWSLVWLNIVQNTAAALQLWVISGWRPSLVFDKEKIRGHFNFGYRLTLTGLIDTAYQNIYHVIIGKFFSVEQLGFFTRAQSLKQLPISNISIALNKVTYPLFSTIQNDNVRLKSAYRKVMQAVLFVIAPTMVLLSVMAVPLFRMLLTEKWLPAVPYFQILCMVGIMYPLHAYNLNILKVKGRTDLVLKLEIIKKTYVTIGVMLSLRFGIYGLLYFQLASTLISFFINTAYSGKLIDYPVWEQIRDILPILCLAFIMGAVSYYTDLSVSSIIDFDFARLLITAIVSMTAYLLMGWIFKLRSFNDLRTIILRR